jgi:RNA polymerase sigma factor (sigma-70 family)
VTRQPKSSPEAAYLTLASKFKRLAIQLRVPVSEREDCVQETWLALMKMHPDWSLDEPVTHRWLLAVARNKARDCHRRMSRGREISTNDMARFAWTQTISEQPDHHSREGAQPAIVSALSTALKGLPEIDREILAARAVGEQSYREIATRLKITTRRAKEHYQRARRKVMRLMTADDHGAFGARNGERGGGSVVALGVQPACHRLLSLLPFLLTERGGFAPVFGASPNGLARRSRLWRAPSCDINTMARGASRFRRWRSQEWQCGGRVAGTPRLRRSPPLRFEEVANPALPVPILTAKRRDQQVQP